YWKLFVANGQDGHLVDALAVSPLAAAGRTPILLTDTALSTSAQEYAKLSLLPNNTVALGGETVVAPAVLTALTAGQVYAEDNASQGSSDAANLAQIKDNLTISGNNVTLKNAKADYSIYVSGNNVTLENVTVTGSVFLDPGAEGTATMNNVTAANIAILSGAQNSIHLNDTKSGSLRVASENAVRIESKGTTNITNTVVSSAAILDAVAGSFGSVEVTQATAGSTQVVEFRGTIGNVTVTGEVTVKAGAGATITKISIAPESKDTKVTLDGTFAAVEVNKAGEVALAAGAKVTNTVVNASATLNATTGSFGKVEVAAQTQTSTTVPEVQLKGTFTEQIVVKGESKLTLADSAKVTNIVTEAKAEIIVPPTAVIEKLEDTGNTGTVVSGGGEVNGVTTTTTPTAPPPTTTTPTTGGGTTTTPTITNIVVIDSNATKAATVTSNDVHTVWTLDLTTFDNNDVIQNIQVTTSRDATISDGFYPTISFVSGIAKTLTLADIGVADNTPAGVTIGTLKAAADVNGYIYKNATSTDSINTGTIQFVIKVSIL
ncbi:MAG: cell wall-binding repeat-containing protein, partial [Desulfitobacteriaceae bacterium]